MKAHPRTITDEMLIEDLRRVYAEHGKVTSLLYQEHGQHSVDAILARFGSWARARVQAGIVQGSEAATVEQWELKRGIGKKRKPRTCLKCDKPFPSDGPHNRICDPCSGKNHSIMHGIAEAGIVHPRRWRQAV